MASLAELLEARRERKRRLLRKLEPLQADIASDEERDAAYFRAVARRS